jgi:antitoxin component YwqK of YwqJK toxin-antitoxin module
MKLRFKTLPVLAGIVLCITSLHAQTDTISGVYLDGQRVDTINCNSFSRMDFVFTLPQNAKYQEYLVSQILILPRGYHPVGISRFMTVAFDAQFGISGDEDDDDLYRNRLEEILKIFSYREMENKYLKNGIVVYPNTNEYRTSNYKKYQYAVARNHHYRKRFRKDRKAKGIDYIEGTLKVSLRGKRPDGINTYLDTSTYSINFNTSYRYEDVQTFYVKVRLQYVRKESKIKEIPKSCRFKSGTTLDMITKPNGALSVSGTLNPFSENYPNGILKAQGQKNATGNAEGTWKFFSAEGKLQRISNYKNGVLHGESRYYDESGKLYKTERFVNGELSGN